MKIISEVFYTKSYTYYPIKSSNTIYLHVKTQRGFSIRLCGRPDNDMPCYEVSLPNYYSSTTELPFFGTLTENGIRTIFHSLGFCVFRKICLNCEYLGTKKHLFKRNGTALVSTELFVVDEIEWNSYAIVWDYDHSTIILGHENVP